jgi:hypothetical protein
MGDGKRDRKAYMREYMRARRKSAKAEAGVGDNTKANVSELTDDALRRVIREEIEAALAPLLERLAQLMPESAASGETIQYWRGGRCQSEATRGGRQCLHAGDVVVRALDHRGGLGEFIACKAHAANFVPHLSVLTQKAKP